MGFNLGDALAGAAVGFGNGLSMNAKSAMDSEAQAETDRRRAEIEEKRMNALAKLNRELTQPDRDQAQKNFDRTSTQNEKYQQRSLDNTERATTSQIESSQRSHSLSRDQLAESSRHNQATEKIGANNTEARISIAEMRAANSRLSSSLRDAEQAAQLPKEQLEYLKGFSSNRGKVLSDTLMPEQEKKKALAALDADLYMNYPPAVQQNEKGQFRTRDVLGRTRTFANEKELAAGGFEIPQGAKSTAPKEPAKTTGGMAPDKSSEWAAQLNGLSDERLKEIANGNDAALSPLAKRMIKDRYNKLPATQSLVDMMNGGAYGMAP